MKLIENNEFHMAGRIRRALAKNGGGKEANEIIYQINNHNNANSQS